MKNFLFSFIFVLLACPLLAQQQPNVLLQSEYRLPGHSIMPRHTYPEQNQKMVTSCEMDFQLQTMQNKEMDIKVDSVFFSREEEDFKENYIYNASGNMLTNLRQVLENYIWVNDWLDNFTYDANGNMLIYLSQGWENGVWENDWLSTYTYDANGNILNRLSQDWENGA